MTQQSADNCTRFADGQAFPPVIELLSIDSTNNYALQLLRQPQLTDLLEMPRHGLGVFAHEQYAGKGQRGKTWLSANHENIHLSVIIDPKRLIPQPQFGIIAIVALAVRNFFEQIAQSDIYIKWPNDIYFKGRKAGGILIENIITGNDWRWAVAGIGLNINQTEFDDELSKKAVSIKQITGKHHDCFELAKNLRNTILYHIDDLAKVDIMQGYNKYLYKKGEKVTFEKDGHQFEAMVKEVSSTGELILQTDMELTFDFGDVNWVL